MEFVLEQITTSFFVSFFDWLVGFFIWLVLVWVLLFGWFGRVFWLVLVFCKYRKMSYLNGGFSLLYVLKLRIKLHLLSLS